MKKISEIIDYRDSYTVNKVFETVKQKREAQKIKEAEEKARLEVMSTHEELIKDDEDIIHEAKDDDGKYFFKNILFLKKYFPSSSLAS